MGVERKGTCGADQKGRPCDGSTAGGSKTAAYRSLLDTWWPPGAPFPPAAPWVRTYGSRAQIAAGLERVGQRLPMLPSPGDPMDPENLSMVSEFILALDRGPGGRMAMGCDKEDEPSPSETEDTVFPTCNPEGCECLTKDDFLDSGYTIEQIAEIQCEAHGGVADWQMCYEEADDSCNLFVTCKYPSSSYNDGSLPLGGLSTSDRC